MSSRNGGELIVDVLERQGVRHLYSLCGGHISPILVAAQQRGIAVIDVRDEANAAFAADATSRLTGVPGVAAVTAGPGVTNTLTAVKNAQLAESPLILLGGAAPTVLKGRGALQDIDQMACVKAYVKETIEAHTVGSLIPAVERAFKISQAGVPGPVFVEVPIDVLYPETLIRGWYTDSTGGKSKKKKPVGAKAVEWYIDRHLNKMFAPNEHTAAPRPIAAKAAQPLAPVVAQAAKMIAKAQRPVLLVGSQAMTRAGESHAVAAAVERIGMPTWLAGMSRGLLGRTHPLHMRHKRRNALKDADLVILAGVPADFRLDYGRVIGRQAKVITVNLSPRVLVKNKLPSLPVHAEPGRLLQRLGAHPLIAGLSWPNWQHTLQERDDARDAEIAAMAEQDCPGGMNPLAVCKAVEDVMDDDSIIVADGGDFVGSAAYICRPRGPLRWLDPGVFGTLGVGAGFALAAAATRPSAETWLIYGDGAAGFSIVEFDTFARHKLGVIAVVGNDACWTQIARDQVEILESDVGTVLNRTRYDKVADGFGGKGFNVKKLKDLPAVLVKAKALAAKGVPVLINCHIGKSDFRKGSISM
ncbi:MAG: thiamine pyrophosphate-binding protein [Myxococcales bacterium]|nr:thiamine pyrophosphate-binding protein [Myxococcales bacterium]